MIISYKRYSRLTLDDIESALKNDAQLLIFFLFTSYDVAYQSQLRRLSRDIHELTGNHCAAIVFAPPSPDARIRAENLAEFANREDEPRLWKEINQTMTENSYEIADSFGIHRDELPAILFLGRDSENYAYTAMRMVSLSEFYQKFRTIIAKWLEQNRAAFSLRSDITFQFCKRELLPEVATNLQSSSRVALPDVEKTVQLVKRLARHPQEIRTLEEFIKSKKISLRHNGNVLTHRNIRKYIHDQIGKRVEASKVKPIVFPIDAIRAADRRVKVESLYSKAKDIRDEVFEWFSKLLPFLLGSQTTIQVMKDVTVDGDVHQIAKGG